MKNTFFYLSTCSTCTRIIKELRPDNTFYLQDIKKEKISESVLGKLAEKAGSYEALFSRKAMKYRSLGLNEKKLTEADYKKLILDEYTFLKRPVIVYDNAIFIGNAKKTIEEAKAIMHK